MNSTSVRTWKIRCPVCASTSPCQDRGLPRISLSHVICLRLTATALPKEHQLPASHLPFSSWLPAREDLVCPWTPEIICTVMSVPTCSPWMMKASMAQPTTSSRSSRRCVRQTAHASSWPSSQDSSPSIIVAGAYLSTLITSAPTCNTETYYFVYRRTA
jgi:hypothetical protein